MTRPTAGPLPQVEGGYHTILADPAWRYGDNLPGPGRGAAKHYETMSVAEIMALPVEGVASENAHLYVWATNAFVVEAHAVCRAWGFQPKTMVTWEKVNKAGGPHIGMGHYFRNSSEHLVFAVRGRQAPGARNIPTVVRAPRGRHSEKPQAFYDVIRLMSPGPRLELFARGAADGFDSWGLEAPG